MSPYERNAKAAGALILLGYVAYGVPQGTYVQPLLDAPDPLAAVAADATRLTVGTLAMSINSVAVVGIGLCLSPVLKRHDDTVALGYVATRVFESIVLIGGLLALLLLVPLSQEYVRAGAADATSLRAIATLAVRGNTFAYHVAMGGLAIGSLPFCYVLFRSKLVPRAISVLGLIGYPALLALMVVEIFGAGAGPVLYVLYVPGAAFEIGVALWLVVRGFEPSAIIAEPAASR